MLDAQNGMLRWNDADALLMSRIIGSSFAVVSERKGVRSMPFSAGVLKHAIRKGALVSDAAIAAHDDYATRVATARALKRLRDWPADRMRSTDPLAAKYFPYQRADLRTMYELARDAYMLTHQPGVGKTLLALRYMVYRQSRLTAIIVRNAAKEQWAEELRRWAHDHVTQHVRVVHGTIAEQSAIITTAPAQSVVIGHWESLVYARKAWLSRDWQMVIADEAHMMQNPKAQRTEIALALGARARIRLALTAHPYANGIHELFPILQFLEPTLYTSFWRWAATYIQMDEGPWGELDLNTPKRPKLLKYELAPFTLRRLWKQVRADLPPVTRQTLTVDLNAAARREYEKLRKQFFVELEGLDDQKNILAIPSALARYTRLRQYLIDPAILGAKQPSVKYPAIADLVADLRGRPPVIFTMFRQAAERLYKFLETRRLRAAILAGGMSQRVQPLVKNFMAGKYDAFIVVLAVGSESLNLGKYGTLIYLDTPWTAKAMEQSEGRVNRPETGTGRMVPVTCYNVVVRDSYEQRMHDKRADKASNFEKVFTVRDARAVL